MHHKQRAVKLANGIAWNVSHDEQCLVFTYRLPYAESLKSVYWADGASCPTKASSAPVVRRLQNAPSALLIKISLACEPFSPPGNRAAVLRVLQAPFQEGIHLRNAAQKIMTWDYIHMALRSYYFLSTQKWNQAHPIGHHRLPSRPVCVVWFCLIETNATQVSLCRIVRTESQLGLLFTSGVNAPHPTRTKKNGGWSCTPRNGSFHTPKIGVCHRQRRSQEAAASRFERHLGPGEASQPVN